ncbi:MAG: acyl-CoA dehydrogenase family protein, partial [Pseudomonadota bacterium]
MTYRAPVEDTMFALNTAVGLPDLIADGVYGDLDADTIAAVLDEAGKFGAEVLDPLNWSGDQTGAKRDADGSVKTPDGFAEAYHQFVEGGWAALPGPESHGGQGLPEIVSMAAAEVWNATNMAFGLCPLLTQGAVDALRIGGSAELKDRYLPKLVSGEWTGTMNLTEPHAGSDLSVLKARAERHDDGTYRVFGTKIYITYGEHDFTNNIIHFVLARLPDAPEGTKGISLFLVPKVRVNDDGSLGAPNDVTCAGIEHKLGIHGSPTCTMKYGESGEGAVGYLVGQENRGLATMFIMMNAARLAVGMQGVAIADRATQRAIAYANERTQGKAIGTIPAPGNDMVPIVAHPDVRRTLLTMQAMTQAARAICLMTAREMDLSHRAKDDVARAEAGARAAMLTPIAKALSTDIGCEVASLGVQMHGGMGFVEETGAAQYYRDARILPIYEGTNGIQAIDLAIRKLPLGNGAVLNGMLDEFGDVADDVRGANHPEFGMMGQRLSEGVTALREASEWMVAQIAERPEQALASATPYLRLFGLVAGGTYLAKGALSAARDGSMANGHARHVSWARIFAETQLAQAPGLN